MLGLCNFGWVGGLDYEFVIILFTYCGLGQGYYFD